MPLTPFRLWHIAAGCIEVETGTSLESYTTGQWVSAPRSFVAQKMHAGTELLSLSLDWRLADGTTPLLRIPEGVLDLGRRARRLRRLVLAQSRLRVTCESTAAPFGDTTLLPALVDAQAGLWRIAHLLVEAFPETRMEEPTEPQTDTRVALAMRTLRLQARSRFPAERLVQVTGLGRRRLEQLFQAKSGTSPRAYHAQLRMEEARALVVQGRMPFRVIASTLEFASPTAFTQAFIRGFGMSPSAYQDQARA